MAENEIVLDINNSKQKWRMEQGFDGSVVVIR